MARGSGDVSRLLTGSDFRRLLATRLASQFSSGVFEASLAGFLLFSPTSEPTAAKVALALAVLLLPYTFVDPFAGILIDRLDRRRVLVAASALQVMLLAVLALLMARGDAGVGFYVDALGIFSANRFVLATLPAAQPLVVPTELLTLSNSLATTLGTLVTIAGLGAGTLVRALVGHGDHGVAVIALAAAACYVLTAFAAAGNRRHTLGPPAGSPTRTLGAEVAATWVEVTSAARYVAGRREARNSLVAITVHRLCFGFTTVATLLLYRRYFHGGGVLPAGIAGLSEVYAMTAIGYGIAAVLTPLATRRIRKQAWIVWLMAFAAFCEVAFGVPYDRGWFLLAALGFGLVSQGGKITVDTIVQEDVLDHFRGRAFSFYDMLYNGTFVAAAALAAITLPPDGKSYTMLGVVAGGYALTAIGYFWATRVQTPQPQALEPREDPGEQPQRARPPVRTASPRA